MAYYTQQKGDEYETLACRYLRKQGLKLLEKNFRCRYGEIDLIMQHDRTLVFVEVRYRKSNNLVDGAESINHAKQMRIHKTAEYYLQQHKLSDNTAARIDVMSINGSGRSVCYDWIQNAF